MSIRLTKKAIVGLILPAAIFLSVLLGGGYVLFRAEAWLLSEISDISGTRG